MGAGNKLSKLILNGFVFFCDLSKIDIQQDFELF